MAHPFEVRKEIEVDASPEEVWEAIATGPGIDSWFMGTNEVEPREGGRARMTLPGWSMESTVTAWDPPTRFVTETEHGEDGRFMAFEYIIEGREGGSTVVRFVHSGFLAGDDWETEYEALKSGDPMYIEKLAEYLKYLRRGPAGARAGLAVLGRERFRLTDQRQERKENPMDTVTSKDGTTIAFDRLGEGPAVILVSGGSVDRMSNAGVAALLASDFTVF